MRFCYADPPYPGQARKHYAAEAAADGRVAVEVNHRVLIGSLMQHYPDGWALSTSEPALYDVLPMCPRGVRVMPWVKPFASLKPGVNPGYCWEPVIVWGGRKRTREQPTTRDYLSCNITLRRGFPGAKPAPFCYWLFDVLNVQDGDEFEDLFPGSGAVTWALNAWRAARRGEVYEAPLFNEEVA